MTERQSARMSKIKDGGLDQYGAEPFKQQQFGTAGVEGGWFYTRRHENLLTVKAVDAMNADDVGRDCILVKSMTSREGPRPWTTTAS